MGSFFDNFSGELLFSLDCLCIDFYLFLLLLLFSTIFFYNDLFYLLLPTTLIISSHFIDVI